MAAASFLWGAVDMNTRSQIISGRVPGAWFGDATAIIHNVSYKTVRFYGQKSDFFMHQTLRNNLEFGALSLMKFILKAVTPLCLNFSPYKKPGLIFHFYTIWILSPSLYCVTIKGFLCPHVWSVKDWNIFYPNNTTYITLKWLYFKMPLINQQLPGNAEFKSITAVVRHFQVMSFSAWLPGDRDALIYVLTRQF